MNDCTEDEVSKIITDLQNGKASDIPVHIVKSTGELIVPHLTKYFNLSLSFGLFPDVLKTGRITPIYKKDSEDRMENYRPVSTLPVFGKILEKLIYSRFYSFFIAKGLIYENQFGFRKGHSTTHAVNYSIDHIQQNLKQRKHVLGIFIDLSKAFDTLAHDRLIDKLEHYGIRGSALNLIKSYLSGRTQYVNVLDEKSDTLPMLFGVPQGSVLGPLLFLLYINDISNASDKGKFVLFADDTNVFIAADTIELAYSKANEVLASINTYMESNLLHINGKKCCYMYFQPSNKSQAEDIPDNLQLHINGSIIRRVRHTKFLGVTIDDKLSWQPHIDELNSKLKSACGRIYRVISFLPKTLHKTIYHTLFESHLAYAVTVWGGVSRTKLEPLFRTQKKCIRIIFGDTEAYLDKFRTCARSRPFGDQTLGSEFYKKEPSKPLFTRNNILTIHNLYKHRIIVEVYNILKFSCPVSLYYLFTRSKRKSDLLYLPHPGNGFVYRASALWNKFRQSFGTIDLASSGGAFKNSLKNSLLAVQQSYSEEWCDKNFTELSTS